VKLTAPVDVPRLIRIASVACAIFAGALVYVGFEPQLDALRAAADGVRSELRSDDIVFADEPRLREERDALRRRYANLFRKNPQAVFFSDLAVVVRRHRVELVSTNAGGAPPDGGANPTTDPFARSIFTLELRGPYRRLLATIVDLSRGREIVRVEAPSFRRDGDSLVASVPVSIFEPAADAR
jgi:hypothetical protein